MKTSLSKVNGRILAFGSILMVQNLNMGNVLVYKLIASFNA